MAFGLVRSRLGDASGNSLLEEAVLNAVYHGNLGVRFPDLKLSGDGSFERLAAQLPSWKPRTATAGFV